MLRKWWKHFVVTLTPLILLLPLLLIPEEQLPWKANQCLYVLLLMSIYWCTESLPLPVTGMIPIFIFPLFGILSTEDVCKQYLKDFIMMLSGGMMIALAVEKCNLHRRIAISMLHLMGTKPLALMMGFILPSWFLSMWISNTATTAMMLPIGEAVLESLAESYKEGNVLEEEPEDKEEKTALNKASSPLKSGDGECTKVSIETGLKTTGNASLDNFGKGVLLAIAYGASIGGTGSFIGQGTNVIAKAYADEIWQSHGFTSSPINFTTWPIMGLPTALSNMIVLWLWLTVYFNGIRSTFPCRKLTERERIIQIVIDREYNALGRIRYDEIMVAVMFGITILLWFFRSPNIIKGWADFDVFEPGYVKGAVVPVFIIVLLCIIPSSTGSRMSGPYLLGVPTLLDWETIQRKFPWGLLFLFGGGYSLALGSKTSGLSEWIAESLVVITHLPGWLMVLVICLISSFLTELTSNVATCTLLMPIVAAMAETSEMNPLYLIVPVSIASSLSFMLPVATPPNAIAYSLGRLRIIDMAKAGFILNLLCVFIVTLGVHTWADLYFHFDQIPWNVTSDSLG